ITAKQNLVPHPVLLNQHEGMVELKRPVVEGRTIGVDIGMLSDGDHTLALVRMGKVSHNDLHFRKANGHIVKQAREGARQRRFVNECGPGMKEYRQAMTSSVLPKIVQVRLVGLKAGIHGQQLDSFEPEILMPLVKLILPPRLGWVDG